MKILLIDDHTLFRDGLVLLLQRVAPEHELVTAADCAEGFASLENNADTDLVLLDLDLPDMPGTEAIKIFRERHPELPIVVISGTQDVDTVLAAVRDGAMGFIPKTHSPTLLVGALDFILVHKGVYLPPELLFASRSSQPPTPPAAGVTRPSDLGLTPRQADVLYHVLQGKSNKAIARVLGVEENTVRSHVTVVLKALRVTTRTEAVVAANKMRLVFADVPASGTASARGTVNRS